jgi:adenylate cyclase
MPQEIERKFLICHDLWDALPKPEGRIFRQGYILTDPQKTIRVRLTTTKAYLTIKGLTTGASRLEYEYEIPRQEATELLDHFAATELSKTRYMLDFKNKTWEIDVFSGDNTGLIVAEIELQSEDELFDLPEWIDEEVTGDARYYNANLTLNPYCNWDK